MSLATDALTIGGVATLLPIFRIFLRTCVHKPLVSAILKGRQPASSDESAKTASALKPELDSLRDKCLESLWKVTVYSMFASYELYVAMQYAWFRDPSQLFDNWPGHVHPDPLRSLYHVAFGFAVSCIYMHHFWETRRSDHHVMLTHHIITLGLVAGSYYLNILPVGCMVLLCHDCNDIPMEIAKMCKYGGFETGATVMFAVFTVLWCITRLYVFPFVVIRACFVYLNPRIDELPVGTVIGVYALEALLCSLCVIHAYWTTLIFKVVVKALKNEIDDVRED